MARISKEQPGTGHYANYPTPEPWEDQSKDAAKANDSFRGQIGDDVWQAGDPSQGGAEWVSHPNPGTTLRGDKQDKEVFEQGDLPSTEINYHSF